VYAQKRVRTTRKNPQHECLIIIAHDHEEETDIARTSSTSVLLMTMRKREREMAIIIKKIEKEKKVFCCKTDLL
jgi:hypothetical protein